MNEMIVASGIIIIVSSFSTSLAMRDFTAFPLVGGFGLLVLIVRIVI